MLLDSLAQPAATGNWPYGPLLSLSIVLAYLKTGSEQGKCVFTPLRSPLNYLTLCILFNILAK